jgi:carboxypeptidase Taq
MNSALDRLKARMYDLNALGASMSMMGWDQQTYMPRGGAEARAEHMSILSRMAHELFTDDATAKLLSAAKGEATGEDALMLKRVQRDYDLSTKIPTKLVEEKTKLGAIAHEEWVLARQNNDFKSFAPTLKRMFEIAREEADHLGFKEHVYDALLDQYEEGATAADARKIFDTLKRPVTEMVKQIKEAGQPDDSSLYGEWDTNAQKQFTEMLVQAIGFDMERGRQDTAPHPFCTGWSIGDIRLTTRYKPYLGAAIFGSLHEAGHGMYEQGSPMKWDRSPLAGGTSLGVHESQSRLWENIVGRSRPFWSYFLPKLNAAFPTFGIDNLDKFYRAINRVEPSLIRVEADEVTYNLHVCIRFEIECAMLEGTMEVKDMPEVWNQKYEEYLGVRPATDSDGCLQDVHWSMGSIGYFPTYTMGNLLSYQFWTALKVDLPDAEERMARGDFKAILEWLQLKIYRQGRSMPPKELVKHVTGKPMGADDYIAGLTAKYRELYGLK